MIFGRFWFANAAFEVINTDQKLKIVWVNAPPFLGISGSMCFLCYPKFMVSRFYCTIGNWSLFVLFLFLCSWSKNQSCQLLCRCLGFSSISPLKMSFKLDSEAIFPGSKTVHFKQIADGSGPALPWPKFSLVCYVMVEWLWIMLDPCLIEKCLIDGSHKLD